MDCCDATGLLSFEKACNNLINDVNCTLDSEDIPLPLALNRILATDIRASLQVPASDNSAMDGYALRAGDVAANTCLKLVGQSYAGHPYSGRINPGECIRIMTGAVMPADADAVEMQENTSATGDQIYFSKPVKPGQHVRRAGEDIDRGDTVLTAGRRLTPVDIGLLASLGITSLRVYKPLRIAVFSSGDELCSPGATLTPGGIYESNGFVICAMLRKLGFDVLDLGIIVDTEQAIEDAFSRAAESSDVIISSGGVSVGDADYIKKVLLKIGEINFWKVAIKPGKPFVYGRLGKLAEKTAAPPVFFGLPGNPVSAVVTLDQLAIPALCKMAGEQVKPRLQIQAPLAHGFKRHSGRTEFLRGQLSVDDQGNATVSASTAQGSGILSSFTESNGYIVIPREKGDLQAGELVAFQPYDRALR